MSNPDRPDRSSPQIDQAASAWLLRLDRGLTPEEQDAYTQWLTEDERHREAMKAFQWSWEEFDRLAGMQTNEHAHIDPDLLEPQPRRYWWQAWTGQTRYLIPLAAAIAVGLFVVFSRSNSEPASTNPSLSPVQQLLLARIQHEPLTDGSTVFLNRGSSITTDFSTAERRVELVSGEANFTVAKDPDRPFIVQAGDVRIRAVGTAFNVRYSADGVDVIVTEGIVVFDSDIDSSALAKTNLVAGDRALVKLEGGKPRLSLQQLDEAALQRELQWQPRLLDFDDQPLRKIVAAFNESNQLKIEINDPDLADLRLSSAFWSDNVEAFVRLMNTNFGLEVVWLDETTISLKRRDSI